MKKQKLKLDALRVQSFVTEFTKEQNQTWDINGGALPLNNQGTCGSHHQCCPKKTQNVLCPTKVCDIVLS